MDKKFFDYYQKKLKEIRSTAKEFAQTHPDVASQLNITKNDIVDPHVERLLEGFAYLIAGLEEKLDNGKNRVSTALADLLCPSLVRPIPSSVILKMTSDETALNEINVPKGSIFSTYHNDQDYKVTTSYNIKVSPIEIYDIALINGTDIIKDDDKNFIKITLQSPTVKFSDFSFSEITFFISGNGKVRGNLYRIFSQAKQEEIFASYGNNNYIYPIKKNKNYFASDLNKLQTNSENSLITSLGFKNEESVLPQDRGSNFFHNLLTEYFHCPDKFFFFKLHNFNNTFNKDTNHIELFFPVEQDIKISPKDLEEVSLITNCTPATNLFVETTKPISINHENFEQQLTFTGDGDKKIYNVNNVFITSNDYPDSRKIEPYFGSTHWLHNKSTSKENKEPIFWHTRYNEKNNMVISLHGFDYNESKEVNLSLYTESFVFQNGLKNLNLKSKFITDRNIGICEAINISRPTNSSFGIKGENFEWRIVSHMLINYNTIAELVNGESHLDIKKWLNEVIGIYSREDKIIAFNEIEMITSINIRDCVGHIGMDAWRGFVKGKKIEIEVKSSHMEQEKSTIFLILLHKLFLSKISVNSFIEMDIIDSDNKQSIMNLQSVGGGIGLL